MISVIIPSRGESVALWATVASAQAVLEADGEPHEIIVVLNERPFDEFPPLAYFMFQHEMCDMLFTSADGPAAARNLGAARARGDFLVFVDAHCIFPPGFFRELRCHADSYDADAVFGGTRFCKKVTYGCTVGWDDILWGLEMVPTERDAAPFPIVAVGHGAFGIRAASFFDVGGYWSALRGWGGEETQLNLKLWMMGKRLLLAPSLHHFHYTLPGVRRGFEMYRDRDFTRNFLLTASAYGGDAQARKVYEAFRMHYWVGEELHRDVLAEVLDSDAVRVERRVIAEQAKYKTLDALRAMFESEKVVA